MNAQIAQNLISLFTIRYCAIQLKVDKKRLRKEGKVLNKSRDRLHERVIYLLERGRLKDFTHPSEVDKYLKPLYEMYEYLTVLEYLLKHDFYKSQLYHRSIRHYDDIKYFLIVYHALNKVRRRILFYMLNGIKPIMGVVAKNRFYGKRRYWGELFNLFTETFIENISKLRYKPEKTRLTVYAYQSFWLAGISKVKKIEADDEKYVLFPEYIENRGLRILSTIDENLESLIENLPHRFRHELNPTSDEVDEQTDEGDEQTTNVEKADDDEKKDDVKIDETLMMQSDDFTDSVHSSIDHDKLRAIMAKILFKLKIDPNKLYDMSDRKLHQLGRKIRKLIESGQLDITEEELRFLKTYMGIE